MCVCVCVSVLCVSVKLITQKIKLGKAVNLKL